MSAPTRRRHRRQQVAARGCFRCHTPMSRRVVWHPSGAVLVCQECGHLERAAEGVLRAVGR